MKVQVELDISLSAKATIKDNSIDLTVSGSIPYGKDRQVTGQVKGASKKVSKMFEDAFAALLAEKQDELVKVAQANQAEAIIAATRMGEL